MTIQNAAVLVELNISVWTASKLDRSTTEKVTADAGAQADAGQFRKNLMAGTDLRKNIANFAASCRLWHNTVTLPWADQGPRLLPTSLFLDYKTEVNKRIAQFEAMTEEFYAAYPALFAAAPQHLGSMFNPDDYPTIDALRSKFGFRVVFSPLPAAGDFRLDVASQDMDELRQQYEDAFTKRLGDAMRTPWEKLHEMLTNMSAKLTEVSGDEKRRWHDTFLTNAQDMCRMLTHLNLTGDPKLEDARRQLERALVGLDISDIKDSPACRADAKAKVDAILNGFDW